MGVLVELKTNKMIKITKLIAALLLMLPLLTGCKSTKVLTPDSKSVNVDNLYRHLMANRIDAEWFMGKAKVSFDNGEQSISASSLIKMQKGEKLWMNVKKLGIEGARVLVTKDSVFLLSRLDKTYVAESLDYLEKNFQLPADLNLLQDVILGNPIILTEDKKGMTVTKEGIFYKLATAALAVKSNVYVNKNDLLMTKIQLESGSDKQVKANYKNYAELDGKNFSYLRDIEMKEGRSRTSVQLEFSKVELNVPQNIKFSIPDTYKPMQ